MIKIESTSLQIPNFCALCFDKPIENIQIDYKYAKSAVEVLNIPLCSKCYKKVKLANFSKKLAKLCIAFDVVFFVGCYISEFVTGSKIVPYLDFPNLTMIAVASIPIAILGFLCAGLIVIFDVTVDGIKFKNKKFQKMFLEYNTNISTPLKESELTVSNEQQVEDISKTPILLENNYKGSFQNNPSHSGNNIEETDPVRSSPIVCSFLRGGIYVGLFTIYRGFAGRSELITDGLILSVVCWFFLRILTRHKS